MFYGEKKVASRKVTGIFQGGSSEATVNCLNVNTMGPIRMVEAFLPLMEKGERKLCLL